MLREAKPEINPEQDTIIIDAKDPKIRELINSKSNSSAGDLP